MTVCFFIYHSKGIPISTYLPFHSPSLMYMPMCRQTCMTFLLLLTHLLYSQFQTLPACDKTCQEGRHLNPIPTMPQYDSHVEGDLLKKADDDFPSPILLHSLAFYLWAAEGGLIDAQDRQTGGLPSLPGWPCGVNCLGLQTREDLKHGVDC